MKYGAIEGDGSKINTVETGKFCGIGKGKEFLIEMPQKQRMITVKK